MYRFAARTALRSVSFSTKSLRNLSSLQLQRLTPSSSSIFQKRNYPVYKTGGLHAPPKQLTFKEVEARVLKAIKAWDRFPQDRLELLNMEARFQEDLGLDSLDLVEIVMALEDEFGFEVPDQDVEKFKTPRDIFKYVCDREDVYE